MNKSRQIDVLTIIAITVLSYGLQILWLGFFQDDWNFIYFSSTGGSQGLLNFLIADGRPGAIWVYILGFNILGYKPALWQIFSITLRMATTINFWIILTHIWPTRRYGNLTVSIFFLAYPFFTLQPLSVAYAPHFMAYFLYSLSILLMIQAMKKPDKYLLYSIPALFCTFIHLFTVEYFVGLELLRPLIIWFVASAGLDQTDSKFVRKKILTWLPYLFAFMFFIFWRSEILTQLGVRHDPLEIFSDSGKIIISIARNITADLVLMLVSSWYKLIDPQLFVIGPVRNFYFLAVSALGGTCFYFLAKPANRNEAETDSKIMGVLLTGGFAIAAGMIAPYAIGYIIHIKISPWNSRFALPMLPGLALAVSGLIEILITSRIIRHFFLAILIGLVIGSHNNNTLDFKSAWEKQARFYQQLIWRAPSIKTGTAIIANEEILGYMGDYPTSFGINTIYGSKQVEENLAPYWFFALSENFNFSVENITARQELDASKQPAFFRGNRTDAIFITYEPENKQCLWILRPQDGEYKYLSLEMKKATQYSNFNNILPKESNQNFFNLILKANKNTWCFYYQKADLARQMKDWEAVMSLWKEAQSKGYRPDNGFEYIAFIEANAHLGKWEDAFLLTKTANKITEAMYFILCPTWERLASETPPTKQKLKYVSEAYKILGCVP